MLQRLENGDAAGDEGAEGARETGDRGLAQEIAEERETELKAIESDPAARVATEEFPEEEEKDDDEDDCAPMIFDRVADGDDEKGDAGERSVAQHVVKDLLEAWDDEDEQKRHDGDGEKHDDDRVDHRSDDLVFDLLRLFLELSQTGKDPFENAAEFTGARHVEVKVVKDLGVLCEGFGEGAPAFHGIGEGADCFAEDSIALLFGEDGEGAEERQAGPDEGGELAGEDHQGLRFDRLALEEDDLFPRFRWLGGPWRLSLFRRFLR